MDEARAPQLGGPIEGRKRTANSRRQNRAFAAAGILISGLSVFLASAAIAFAPSPASAAECPNETLRAENGSLALPDCRAYERVTPATKNGAEFWEQSVNFVGDGPRLTYWSFANFAGSEFGSTIGSAYEQTRSPQGWQVRSLIPPATQFSGTSQTTPLYSLAENGESLLGLRRRGQPSDAEQLYVQQGGTLTEIGPEAPPASWIFPPGPENPTVDNDLAYLLFQTATPDLSHVVYNLVSPGASEHSYLWPFDETARGFFPSLYEYAGVGNTQPFLVGVEGGPGSTDLISGCGTSLGSSFSLDRYNAISTDGSVVFFTPSGEDVVGPCASPAGAPAHTELYARVNGETGAAHTVPISEPSATDCATCQTQPITSRREAIFQGASKDGSRVFFLTEQELLPGNPGMNLYEYDFNGASGERVTAISHIPGGTAGGVLGVARVAEDGSHVYFVATSALPSASNSTGATADPGEPNLYGYDTRTRELKFVATLSPEDAGLWSVVDINRQAEATPDGRFLLFASRGDLTPDDSSPVSQLFRYDFASGQLLRISIGQDGFNENGNTKEDPVGIPVQIDRYFTSLPSGAPQKVMSDDGSYIFFESTNALTPKALDHVELGNHVGTLAENIYEWHDGRISLLSDGRDRTFIGTQAKTEQVSSVRLLGTDSSGDDVFFTTASPLVPTDTDAGQDIYDARVGGGFAVPSEPGCSAESCQGLAASQSAGPTPGSSSFVGPRNKKSKPKHPKKHHKKGHHKKKQHKKQGHGRAERQRGGSK